MTNPLIKNTTASPVEMLIAGLTMDWIEDKSGRYAYAYCTLCEQYEVQDDEAARIVAAYDTLEELLAEWPCFVV